MPTDNSNETRKPQLVNGIERKECAEYGRDNLNVMASDWETFQSHEGADGNDMFNQCLLPVVAELADLESNGDTEIRGVPQLKPGDRVLDLGTGNSAWRFCSSKNPGIW